MRFNYLGLVLSSVLVLTSCGKLKKMEENMDDTVATTKRMEETTKRMENTTCDMYVGMRQLGAKTSREDDIKVIENSSDISKKLETAGKYMYGFEYQVWSLSCANIISREMIMEQAAAELLTGIEPFIVNRSNVNVTTLWNKLWDKHTRETAYVIAGALHRVNPLQESYLKGSGEKIIRPLDILLNGLKLNQEKNRGELAEENFPAWAKTVGKYAENAQFLLRVRANFLMAYAFTIADSQSDGDSQSDVTKGIHLNAKSWKPNLESRNPTAIRERITLALQLAKETRVALISLGIDPMVEETLIQAWKNADFSEINLRAMAKGKGDDPARAEAIKELIKARNALLTQ